MTWNGKALTWFRGRRQVRHPQAKQDWLAALRAIQGPSGAEKALQDAPGPTIDTGAATVGPPSIATDRLQRVAVGRRPRRLLPGEIDLDLDDYEVCWAGSKARTDCPSVAELEKRGWVREYEDPWYGSTLMKKRRT